MPEQKTRNFNVWLFVFVLIIIVGVFTYFNSGYITGKTSFINRLLESFGFSGVEDQSSGSELPAPESGGFVPVENTNERPTSAEAGTAAPSFSECKEWAVIIGGASQDYDEGNSITIDSLGDAYVTGYETVDGERKNIWISKLSRDDGTILWTQTHNGDKNDNDVGNGIAFDPYSTDKVVVTGYQDNAKDAWTRKMNISDGEKIWTDIFHNNTYGIDIQGRDVAVDEYGNVYVIGSYYHLNADIFIRKINKNGVVQWTKIFDDIMGTTENDYGYGVALDKEGNIYGTGKSGVSKNKIWVGKFDSNGEKVWINWYDSVEPSVDNAGMGIDTDGNFVYVTGRMEEPGQKTNIWILKLTSAGGTVWIKTYDGEENNDDSGRGIAVNSKGNIYVTGQMYINPPYDNEVVWTIKLDPDGNEIWTRTYDVADSLTDNDEGHGIAVWDDHVYITGVVGAVLKPTSTDILVQKYCGAGLISWWKADGNADDSKDGNNGLLVGNANYVSGQKNQAFNFDGNGDYVYVKENSNLDIDGTLTITSWINIQDPVNYAGDVINKYADPSTTDPILYPGGGYKLMTSNGNRISGAIRGHCKDLTQKSNCNDIISANLPEPWLNTWHHVAFIVTNTQLKLYIDGILQNTINRDYSDTITTNDHDLYIGWTSSGGGQPYFQGSIDDVQIYDIALTDSEIQDVMNG